jgi:YihY family inner membrane protein
VNHLFNALRFLLPPFVSFYGFLMFYKFAPRRKTMFREVWVAALIVTLGMDVLQRVFMLYTKNVTNFDALYGTFGSIVALLMWIYLTGSLIIFGGCFAAAQYEIRLSLSDQSERNRE